ncbi:MAG TPA: ABC transporter permease subunit, partial [Polyangiaceae bacterium]
KLRDRAGPTLLIMAGAMFCAYTLALALAVAGSTRSRPGAEVWILALGVAIFATPTACLAVWTVHRVGASAMAATFVLALSMVASPLAQGRTLLREVMQRDYVRSARALGIGPVRTVIQHALRNAVLPVLALASVEMPTALGGAFVVEKAFGIAGLGEETVRAVQTHDVAWLVGLAFSTALFVTLTSIAADFAVAAIDPRLSFSALRHRRMSA